MQVFRLTNLGSDRRYRLTNPADYSLTYNGLVMAVEKRRSHGWQAFGSYTLSRAYGLQPSSGTTAAGAQVATVGSPPGLVAPPVTFGRDPNDLTNADGRLPNDRPHMLPRHDRGRCAAHRLRRRRQSAALQRQAMGGNRADQPPG